MQSRRPAMYRGSDPPVTSSSAPFLPTGQHNLVPAGNKTQSIEANSSSAATSVHYILHLQCILIHCSYHLNPAYFLQDFNGNTAIHFSRACLICNFEETHFSVNWIGVLLRVIHSTELFGMVHILPPSSWMY